MGLGPHWLGPIWAWDPLGPRCRGSSILLLYRNLTIIQKSYDYKEIFRFMKYSINNLGDPYIESNYGIHSRIFEKSVIDFFANSFPTAPSPTTPIV